MQIGCPTEIKPQEFRVGMTPSAVSEATRHSHNVMVQAGAGAAELEQGRGRPLDHQAQGVRQAE